MYWRRFNQWQYEMLRRSSYYGSRLLRFDYPMAARAPKMVKHDKSQNYIKKLEQWRECAHEAKFTNHMIDYKLSKDNFFVDQDGNTILDLSMQGGSMALGYNPDALIDAR